MANLMHRNGQKVDAICSVTRGFAENTSIVQKSALYVGSIIRVLPVFGIVSWGRIGEPTKDAFLQCWCVIEEYAGLRHTNRVAAKSDRPLISKSPVVCPAVLDPQGPITASSLEDVLPSLRGDLK